MTRHAERAASLRRGLEDLRDSLWIWHGDDVPEVKLRRAWGELLVHALQILAADDELLGPPTTRDWLRARRCRSDCRVLRAFERRSAKGLDARPSRAPVVVGPGTRADALEDLPF